MRVTYWSYYSVTALLLVALQGQNVTGQGPRTPWTLAAVPEGTRLLTTDRADCELRFAVTPAGELHRSRDGGVHWSREGRLPTSLGASDVAFLLPHPYASEQYFLATRAGDLYRGEGDDLVWKQLSQRVTPDANASALAFDEREANHLWLAAGAIYESRDGGERWSVALERPGEAFQTLYRTSGALWVASLEGLFLYEPEELRLTPRARWSAPVLRLVEDEQQNLTAYLWYRDQDGHAAYRSSDHGSTWTPYGGWEGQEVLAVVGRLPLVATEAGVFLAGGAGQPWQRLSDALVTEAELDAFACGHLAELQAQRRTLAANEGCTYAISPTRLKFSEKGESASFRGNVNRGYCTWSVSSLPSWVKASTTRGQGDFTVTLRADANPSTSPRTDVISVTGGKVTLEQAGTPCQVAFADPWAEFPSTEGEYRLRVTASPANCSWTVSGATSWLTFKGAVSGTSNGSVTVVLAANTAGTRRQILQVGSDKLEVTQRDGYNHGAGPGTGTTNPVPPVVPTNPCSTLSWTLAPTTISAASTAAVATVRAASNCSWSVTIASAGNWATASKTNGAGDATVNISAAANSGALARQAIITIGGKAATLTQSAPTDPCASLTASESPTQFPATMATGTLAVQAPAVCTWTATSTASWVTLSAPTTRAGAATVGFTVQANETTAERRAELAVSGRRFTVVQAGRAPCSISVSATGSTELGNRDSYFDVFVTANRPDCAWTVGATQTTVSPSTWIRANVPGGSGSGVVRYSFSAQPLQWRTAVVRVAGVAINVLQRNSIVTGCSDYWQALGTVSPVPATGGTITVDVQARVNCGWSIAPDELAGGMFKLVGLNSGYGPGQVTYEVTPNAGTQRTGTIRGSLNYNAKTVVTQRGR